MAAKKKEAQKKARKDAPNYGELSRELDKILSGIEEGGVDIDDLSARVERATELIKQCREKLSATQIRVQKVVSELEEDADDDAEEVWEDEEETEEEGDL